MFTKSSALVILLVVCCLLLLVACTPSDNPIPPKDDEKEYSNEVQVVVLIGQSNAEGASHCSYLNKTVGEEKAAEYALGYNKVQISYVCTISANTSEGNFVDVKLGQGYSTTQFGPEVGMAEKISELDPTKKVYIVKYVYGGTTLATQWRSPSSKNTGNLYTGAVNFVLEQCQKLEGMDLYPVIKAICWMQGESDASGQSYNAYEQLESNLVADLRQDFAYYKPADSEIGFVDAGISDCVAWTNYQVINSAKQKLASQDEFHVYLDTIAANLRYNGEPAGAPDIYHYDSSSMIKLGHMFGEALLANFLEL